MHKANVQQEAREGLTVLSLPMGASVLSDMISYGTVLGAVMDTGKAQSREQFYAAASENNRLQ